MCLQCYESMEVVNENGVHVGWETDIVAGYEANGAQEP